MYHLHTHTHTQGTDPYSGFTAILLLGCHLCMFADHSSTEAADEPVHFFNEGNPLLRNHRFQITKPRESSNSEL